MLLGRRGCSDRSLDDFRARLCCQTASEAFTVAAVRHPLDAVVVSFVVLHPALCAGTPHQTEPAAGLASSLLLLHFAKRGMTTMATEHLSKLRADSYLTKMATSMRSAHGPHSPHPPKSLPVCVIHTAALCSPQEDPLQKYKERVERLSQQNRVIKICTDAGCLTTVDVGQYFMTKDTEEFSQFTESVACRECTLPRDEKLFDLKGWIRGNTKIGSHNQLPTR